MVVQIGRQFAPLALIFVIAGFPALLHFKRLGAGPGHQEIAQFAARPLLVGLVIALVVAAFMLETYPRKNVYLL
jgi:hypothetical protein